VFNEVKFGTVPKTVTYRNESFGAGGGANYMEPPEQIHPFAQGFAVRVETGGAAKVRPLDHTGWREVAFTGKYPMGMVEYRDPESPVSVSLEAFSPFIPLDADDSGLPVVLMRYTLRNAGAQPAKVRIGGWLENATGRLTVQPGEAYRRSASVYEGGATMAVHTLHEPIRTARPTRPPILFEDFEKPTYEGWTVTGTAFGPGPRDRTKIAAYQGDVGGKGQRVVLTHNTLNGEGSVQADEHVGRLTSREFTIERTYIEFFVGGGNHPGKTCVNLLVDGQVVRTQTGFDSNLMRLANFHVADLEGKRARIEIVDEERGGWGQIAVDHIVFTDEPTIAPLAERHDYGDMALALLDGGDAAWVAHSLPPEGTAEKLFAEGDEVVRAASVDATAPERSISGVAGDFTLNPGEAKTVTFVVAWRFPNLILNRLGKVGNFYATRFDSAGAVVRYVYGKYADLYGGTRKWVETWNDSTLPHWLLDRTMGNTATLATMTCVRFANGRFYGWEGVGCCDGTCGHVWQYAQAVGRLFPSLERSVREMVDFGVAFDKASGLVDFRGEYGNGYAADAQAGYVLRAYREHQVSADDKFLRRIYPQAKKALEYLIVQDADEDGILEGRQHNTLDVDLYGPSSWLTSLYLAALRAGEEMAKEMGDASFARRCRALFSEGSRRFTGLFWNGEYFIHRLNAREHPESLRYGNGCEVDQVMGQGWAWQLNLGRITEPVATKKALAALYRNNFLTDIGPYRDRNKPGRWYAMPGEAGLLMCTFPKGDQKEILGPNPTWASMYFNECWTGSEYEAAGHMVAEGLVEEGMTVARAVHERHHPSRRNPWNEVECSDHYARCMSVYGLYLTAGGFEYHGPKGHLGFAPRVTPKDFRAAFTAAEGWGTFAQKVDANGYGASVRLRHGRLRLRTLALAAPAGPAVVQIGTRKIEAKATRTGDRLLLTFPHDVTLQENEELIVRVGQ
jgi:uncharacterized protein (DUF608 family)